MLPPLAPLAVVLVVVSGVALVVVSALALALVMVSGVALVVVSALDVVSVSSLDLVSVGFPPPLDSPLEVVWVPVVEGEVSGVGEDRHPYNASSTFRLDNHALLHEA